MVYGAFCKIIPASWIFFFYLLFFYALPGHWKWNIADNLCMLFFCFSFPSSLLLPWQHRGSKTTASCFIKLNKDTINIILLSLQQLTGTYHFTCMVSVLVKKIVYIWKLQAHLNIYVSSFSIFCTILQYYILYYALLVNGGITSITESTFSQFSQFSLNGTFSLLLSISMPSSRCFYFNWLYDMQF